MDYVCFYPSPLGRITLASNGKAMTGLWFEGQKYYADTLGAEHEEKDLPVFEEAVRWLTAYFSGKEPDFTPPLIMKTTAFRKAVWEVLLTIPYGQTMTYGQIAQRIARDRGLDCMSAQAVGGAVGHNPISLISPCHRVVGFRGSLTGYAGGIEKKKALLELEKAGMFSIFMKETTNDKNSICLPRQYLPQPHGGIRHEGSCQTLRTGGSV